MHAWFLFLALLPPPPQEPGNAPLCFEDCTEAVLGDLDAWAEQLARGPDHWAGRLQRDLGVTLEGHHGLALGDVDGDGLDDLYVCQPAGLPNLLLQRAPDGTVRDVSAKARVDLMDASSSALLIDLDGDGDQDLAVQTRPDLLLFENREFAGERLFGLRATERTFGSTGLAAADYDLDGDLDLFVCGSASPFEAGGAPLPFHGASNGRPNRLLRNELSEQRWTFVDVTREAGLTAAGRGLCGAALFEDWDEDGDPDLLVDNAFGPDTLYRNDGGAFVEIGGEAGMVERAHGWDAPCSSGVTAADVDGDGRVDLFAGGVLLNGTDGWRPGDLELPGPRFGALFADLTNDGRPELFAPRGYLTGTDEPDEASAAWKELAALSPTLASPGGHEHYARAWDELGQRVRAGQSLAGHARHQVLLNRDGVGLVDVSAGSGLDLLDDGRAAARVDWDLDGWLDLWVANRSGPRLRFLRNRGGGDGRAVALRLEGTTVNRDAIGARVTLELPGGRRVVAALRAGEGHLAQSSKWLHFGLGRAERIERASVRWPGGDEERFRGLHPGGRFVLVEGTGAAREHESPASPAALAPASPQPPPHPASSRTLLPARVPLPMLLAEARDGEAIALSGRHQAPLLLVLFAADAAASLELLGRLASASAEVHQIGVGVVALDAGDDPAQADAALAELDWPFRDGGPTAGGLELLDLIRREQLQRPEPLRLPTAFLLDASGRVAGFYEGQVEVGPLLADASRLSSSAEALRQAAAGFTGRWQAPPPHPDLARTSRRLARAGLTEAAHQLRVLAYDGRELTFENMDSEVGLVRMRQGNYADAAEHFLKAAEVDPSWFPPRRNLGAALLRLGRFDEAARSLELALGLSPAEPGTVRDLALTYARLGQGDQARELRELLELLDPTLGAELAESLRALERER